MYLPRSSCIICRQQISKIQYNLKTTHSKKSNTLLIKLVEKFYSNVSFLHCNICSNCYDLLNELDAVRQREKELYSQLKDYILKIEDSKCLDFITSKSDELSNDGSEDSNISSNNVDDTDVRLPNINLKGLSIKIKKVKSEDRKHTKKPLCVDIKDDNFEADIASEDQNERMFEKIQSSIQMDLSKHIVEHMNKNKPSKNVLCEVCGQSFKTKSGYDNHIKKHDGIEDNLKLLGLNKVDGPCFCNICGKGFHHKAYLSRHLPIHSGERRYQCESCGKKFLHHSSFNMHRKIHAGQRNFQCDVCNRRFLSNSHLKRHVRAAHDKEKSHVCGSCGKKFTENYNLLAHVKLLHKDESIIDHYSEEVLMKGDEQHCEQDEAVFHIQDHDTVVLTLENYD